MTPEELEAIHETQAAEGEYANENDEELVDSKMKEGQPDGEASDQPESPPPGPPQLPEELGLSYEQIRTLLAMKHETTVTIDDPVMMLVTILNAFLSELEKLHGKHNQAVTKIMSAQTADYISGVKATTDTLSQTLADTSVDAIRSIFDNHAKALYSSKNNSRWCAAIIAVSALANIVVMALK